MRRVIAVVSVCLFRRYVLGSGRPGEFGNVWAGGSVTEFTNTTTATFYLRAGGQLTLTPPSSGEGAPTSWVADPNAPIPTLGGNVLMIAPCGPQDQRLVEQQYAANMALFETGPLATPLLINGVITASLWIESSAVDTDVNVKVSVVNTFWCLAVPASEVARNCACLSRVVASYPAQNRTAH